MEKNGIKLSEGNKYEIKNTLTNKLTFEFISKTYASFNTLCNFFVKVYLRFVKEGLFFINSYYK